MTEGQRYAAFISYAHKDARHAAWLHRRLEAFRLPTRLAGKSKGSRPLRPIFRDRDELSAGADLSAAITGALERADALIVVCSPAAAASIWVDREVAHYRERFGLDRIFALIVDGDPADSERPCFPPSLIAPERSGEAPIEPLAADVRPRADGRRGALLKLIAGMLGVGYDQLVQREHARRMRRLTLLAGSLSAGIVATSGLAVYAELQRREANTQRIAAERNERTAESVSDFLINTFAISNPATENANTITARTVLDRGARRIGDDLADEPEVQARLYGAVGRIYSNLALYEEAQLALNEAYELLEAGSVEAIGNRILYATALYHAGRYDDAEAIVDGIIGQRDKLASEAPLILGRAYETRGNIEKERFETEAAMAAYEEAMKVYEQVPELSAFRRGQLLGNWGVLLIRAGELEDAERRLLGALAIWQDLYNDDHLEVGRVLNNLAYVYRSTDRLADARSASEKAIEIYEAVLDPAHPDLATIRIMNGQIQEELGNIESAEQSYRAALDALRRAYPDGHIQTGYAMIYLAWARSQQGATEEALGLLDEAEAQYDLVYRDRNNADYGDLQIYRGLVLATAGEIDRAKELCTEGLTMLDDTLGSDHPYTETMRGRCEEAGVALQLAVE